MSQRLVLALMSAGLCSSAGPALAASGVSAGRAPMGVAAHDWSGICAAYEARRHAVFVVDGGYQARNPGQQWRTNFDGRGFMTTPDADGWSWGLELVRYGRFGAERAVEFPRCVQAHGQCVIYEWDESLSEWYQNDPRGLEHGYTVHQCPEGGVGPLQFTLAVRGDLKPRVSTDGRGAAFGSPVGATVINYSGLTVFDADGVMLPARMSPADEGLRLTVDDIGAHYPITIDPVAQQAYIKASNTGAGDWFGYSVAASGDTVVIGAPHEDSSATGIDGNGAENTATESGAAYVFVRSGESWSQQAYLKASNTGSDDQFGWSVGISGDTVVVGAPFEKSGATGVNGNQNDDGTLWAGAAYVFVRIGTTWNQQAYLKASNTGGNDWFGVASAVSGDTIIVGAHFEDSNATGVNGNEANNSSADSGSAYVFVRNGTTWSQQAYLKASNTGANDQFGWSVAASADTAVIGAIFEDSIATGVNGNHADNSALDAGAAYVFVRSGTTWSQQAYLKASNTGANDQFGWSVSVAGDTVAVGADREDSNAAGVNGDGSNNSFSNAGAAYMFVRSGLTWSHQAYLKASNTGANDRFGASVSVSGEAAVVGAWLEDSNATGVNGNGIDNSASNAGAAYTFLREDGTWSQQAYLKASNTGSTDSFGYSVSLSDGTLVVGAISESSIATGVNGYQGDNSASQSGAAYAFTIVECPSLGNMNCDCALDAADVPAFVQGLLDPAGFAAVYNGCDIFNGDIQPDGIVDGGDVQGFVDLLTP